MAVFELLNKTFFYYPNANSIAMVTKGQERLRINLDGRVRIGIPPATNETLDYRLKSIGERDNQKYALKVTDADDNDLFTVRNDGLVNFTQNGLEISSAQGDWLFLKQRRSDNLRSGFHFRNPLGEQVPDVNTPLNRFEIGYRMPNGQEKFGQFAIHGPTGNVGINTGNFGITTGNPAGDKLRIQGATNNASAFALNIINANGTRLLGVRNDGAIFLDALQGNNPGTFAVRLQNNRLVLAPVSSSQRFKNNIDSFKENFAAILNAEPKSFTWKESGEPGIGYIAEEFHALGLHRLVSYDEQGEPLSINYELIPVYLLEIIKTHHAAIEKLDKENATLKIELSQTQAELHELKVRTAKLESVLAMEISRKSEKSSS